MMQKVIKVIRFAASILTWVAGFVGCVTLNSWLLSWVDKLAVKIKGE